MQELQEGHQDMLENIENYPFGSVFSLISFFRAILEQIRLFFIIFKYPIFQLK